MENIFTKPERPFLLLSEDDEGVVSYSWLETEEELQEVVAELKSYGNRIIDAVEIGSCRTVKTTPDYLVDDFIEEINSAYEKAKEQTEEDFCIVIYTDMEMTYRITEESAGFQYEELGYYFDDLDSVSAALFDERMIGKPVEIKIESR